MKFTQIFFIFTIIVAGALAAAESVPRCPDVCTAQYDPVCATNNRCIRVFSNSCQLGIVNCNSKPNDRFYPISKHYCNDFTRPVSSQVACTKSKMGI